MLVLTRAFFVNSEIYMAFLLNSQAQGASGKMNNLPKHHGAVPPEARGPMQLHRLHRLKASPAHIYGCYSSPTSRSWWITHWTQRQRRGCNNTVMKNHLRPVAPLPKGQGAMLPLCPRSLSSLFTQHRGTWKKSGLFHVYK